MKAVKELDLKNKRVFLRADYNVPCQQGKILEDQRIKASLPTIEYILSQEPKALLITSHLGKPNGQYEADSSLLPVYQYLEVVLGQNIEFIHNIEEIDSTISSGQSRIFVLENLRFFLGEEHGEEDFSKQLAQGFDVYINDAFSVSHRAHASVSVVPKFIAEKAAGLLLEEEFSQLSRLRDNPIHPAVALIGGSKIETKLPVIDALSKIYDKVLVGGKIANEALDQKLDLDENVLLPEDFAPIGKESQRLDIGLKTVERYIQEILNAKTILWNGPLGKFEDEEASVGTRMILEAISSNMEAFRVVGGGETIEAVKIFGSMENFDYVSMSGGAMLEFMGGKNLPGIQALD